MSGIFGFLLRAPQGERAGAALRSMADALAQSPGGASRAPESFLFSGGTTGLGSATGIGHGSEVARLESEGNELGVAIYGTLYDRERLGAGKPGSAGVADEIARIYADRGLEVLERMSGDFALAIWDGNRQSLFLATDRFRVQPIFYYWGQDNLVFASRMRGLLSCPFAPHRTVQPESIVDVVGSSYVPSPRTIFREIRKVEPGHVLHCSRGTVTERAYWELDYRTPSRLPETDLARRTREQLTSAVEARLAVEEDPDRVGTFLSGGIDSSTVTGILAHRSRPPVKAFSIGFDEPRYNELSYATLAARAFGADHHTYLVTPENVLDALPALVESFDEPYGNASAIPTLYCARLAARNGIATLYAGDGGDELFAGNERYATYRLFDLYYKVPRPLREGLLVPTVLTLAKLAPIPLLAKARGYVAKARVPYPDRLVAHSFFRLHSMTEFFAPDFLKTVGADYVPSGSAALHYHRAPAATELQRQLYIDQKLAISDNDLFKVVRMTEAAGIGVRFPFLDHALAEISATIPADVLMRGRELRSFFKRAYAELLPPETLRKPKHGFGLPIAIWLRTHKALNELMHDLVLSPRALQRGYFQERALRDLVARHEADRTGYYGAALWNLMALELWHRQLSD